MHRAAPPHPISLIRTSKGQCWRGSSSSRVAFLLACWLVCVVGGDASFKEVFDVAGYGAAADGEKDDSAAFSAAWKAACQFHGDATFVIPHGTYLLGPVDFGGPCYNGASPSVLINGTLKALPHPTNFHDRPWITFHDLNNLTVSGGDGEGGGILDGQGAATWPTNACHKDRSCQLPPTSLVFDRVSNSTVHGLALVNSKAFHMNFHGCDHIDVHDINITAPGDSPNTDGIHLGESDHINITGSVIGTGDDCISIGPGSTNVFVSDVVCGPGHGISVGSLGKYENEMDVVGLHVRKSTFVHTTNGVRIKTWPGSPASRASNFSFEDIIMINVSNPIIIDQEYCPLHDCTNEPSRVEISNVAFRRISGTSSSRVAVNLSCSKDVPCKHVELLDIMLVWSGADSKTTASCSNVDGSSSGLQIPTPCLPIPVYFRNV